MSRRICGFTFLLLSLTAISRLGAAGSYDPLTVDEDFKAQSLELSVHDSARNRDIPLRVYLPGQTSPEPVVIFSHGLGGSRQGNAFLGEHWAGRGYVAVFVQHPGSDTSVWQDKPEEERLKALRDAMSVANLKERVMDIHSILDTLTKWNAEKGHPLFGRLNLQKIGMSGHSFGAITTQALSGERLPFIDPHFADDRIKAAVAFSPSGPRHYAPQKAFGSVKIPWLLLTGTKDVVPLLGGADMASRLSVYPGLPAPKYQVVLNNAEHSAFTDRALPGDREPRNPNHHRVMLALTTAFWDAYLKGDPAATEWLNGAGPRSILEKEDDWKSAAK